MKGQLGGASSRARVLLCAFACNPYGRTGGEDILGWNIATQISKSYETWVITSSVNRQDIEATVGSLAGPAPRFFYIDVPFWPKRLMHRPGLIQIYAYLWQIRILVTAWRLHRRFHFDLAHHVTYANDWMASIVGALLPVRYLRGPGGGAHRVPKPFLRDYGKKGRVWERLRSMGQWVFRHDPFFINGQRRARAILLCNQEAMDALPATWKKKSALFPVNGISAKDLANLGGGSEEKHDDSFRVLSAGKLINLKGFGLGIKAFGQFAARHENAYLEIIGDGPQRANLEDCIRALRLESRVHLIEWMDRDQFLGRLNSCDAFLFPSLRDGGGAVVIEAMAAGKPVVCLELSGPALHVTDATGFKVAAIDPAQTVDDLAESLEKLYRSPELRVRMGQAARLRATQDYHWDRLGERLSDIYQRVLNDGQPLQTPPESGGPA